MKIMNPLYAGLYLTLFLVAMWMGSIWNSRAQSQDLPPPTEQPLPPDLQNSAADPSLMIQSQSQLPEQPQPVLQGQKPQTPPESTAAQMPQAPPSQARPAIPPSVPPGTVPPSQMPAVPQGKAQMPISPSQQPPGFPPEGQLPSDPMAIPNNIPAPGDFQVQDPNFQVMPEGFEPPVEEIPRLPAPNAEGWVYDPTGRRDPFRPFGAPKSISTIVVVPESLLEPLQKFDLSEIKVLGILWEVSKPRALVRDPQNKVHTVFNQSKIGKNQGVVVGIRESEILVQEVYEEDGVPTKSVKILGIRK